jgi:hypothetical protein
MDNLLFAIWGKAGRRAWRQEEFRLDAPGSVFGRLAAAIAIIGVAACLLDHVAIKGETDTVAPYALATKGSSR